MTKNTSSTTIFRRMMMISFALGVSIINADHVPSSLVASIGSNPPIAGHLKNKLKLAAKNIVRKGGQLVNVCNDVHNAFGLGEFPENVAEKLADLTSVEVNNQSIKRGDEKKVIVYDNKLEFKVNTERGFASMVAQSLARVTDHWLKGACISMLSSMLDKSRLAFSWITPYDGSDKVYVTDSMLTQPKIQELIVQERGFFKTIIDFISKTTVSWCDWATLHFHLGHTFESDA